MSKYGGDFDYPIPETGDGAMLVVDVIAQEIRVASDKAAGALAERIMAKLETLGYRLIGPESVVVPPPAPAAQPISTH